MGLPHHVSAKHRHMSMTERAAQFSPFAALNGYEDAVSETARLTDGRPDLDEYERDAIDRKLREIMESDEDLPVTLTYFRPDAKNAGGAYLTLNGKVSDIDEVGRIVIMESGARIPVTDPTRDRYRVSVTQSLRIRKTSILYDNSGTVHERRRFVECCVRARFRHPGVCRCICRLSHRKSGRAFFQPEQYRPHGQALRAVFPFLSLNEHRKPPCTGVILS